MALELHVHYNIARKELQDDSNAFSTFLFAKNETRSSTLEAPTTQLNREAQYARQKFSVHQRSWLELKLAFSILKVNR